MFLRTDLDNQAIRPALIGYGRDLRLAAGSRVAPFSLFDLGGQDVPGTAEGQVTKRPGLHDGCTVSKPASASKRG